MVQIDFARRTLRIQLLVAGLSGTWTALRALHSATPGCHGPILETPLGAGRRLATTLRPEGLPFLARFGVGDAAPRAGGMKSEFDLFALSGPILESEASAALPSPDGVLYVTDWGLELGERRPAARARLDASLRLRGLDPDTIPIVDYWHDRPSAPPKVSSEHLVFRGSGADREGLLRAFGALGALVLQKLDLRYCSCMFSPERIERFSDLILEVDLSSGVTHAVLAGDSRPALL